MRLAFISYEYPPDTGKGGIGTYVKQIATAMAATSHDIHVFAGSSIRSKDDNENGFWVHRIQCMNGTDFRDKVVAVFEHYHAVIPFDIIESAEINGDAWEVKKKYPDLLLVVRLHASNWLVEHLKKRYVPVMAKLRYVFGALIRCRFDLGYWRSYKKETDPDFKFIQLADGITAPSEAMKSWAVKNWDIQPANIAVLPNIFAASADLLKIPVNSSTDFRRIVFFGRLNVLKGLVNASRAIKKILHEFPDWKFRVIGDDGNGPYVGVSMRYWMQQELSPVIDRVEFIDGLPYEAIPDNIKDAEIVLLPSLFESFSYTCIEAMAAGKAVVGSKSGGMKDLLQNEESGMLTDPESYQEIYASLKRLILNNELRYRVSMNARDRVLKNYDARLLSFRFADYYKQIIGLNHG